MNYIHKDNAVRDPYAFRTAIISAPDGHISHIQDRLHVLALTSECELYSLKDEFTDHQHLSIFDLKSQSEIGTFTVNGDYGYGSAILIEDSIKRLYIAFYGSIDTTDKTILTFDLRDRRFLTQIVLDGRPKILGLEPNREMLCVAGIGVNRDIQLIGIDTISRDGEAQPLVTLDFSPMRAVIHHDQLLLLDLSKGIKILDINRREIVGAKEIPEIYDIAPTADTKYVAILLQRTTPVHYVDRLAIYDLEAGEIIAEERVSGGHLLKFIEGRLFFTEVIGDDIVLDEVKVRVD